jgi:integrase
MSKRANGDGSVFFRKKRQSWCAQLSINGKPVVRYAKSKVEASKKLDILKNQRETGELVKTGKMTISDWSTSWIDFKRSRIKPSTLARYEADLRVNIIPLLGSIRLSDLSTNDVVKLHSTLLARGMSPNTVRHAHCVLSGLLRDAMGLNMILRNVCYTVKIPTIPSRSHNILDANEIKKLLDALFNVQDRTLISLALTTGMRSGEILALRWKDIDLTNNILSIEHTIHFPGGGQYVLGTPKTKSSRRKIKFQKMITECFKELRQYQDQRRELAGSQWNDFGFVFSNDFGRPLTQGGMPRQVLYPALERAGVKRVRFHDLRHTSLSHMIARGALITDVSAIAGHANVSITMSLYAHALPDASDRVTTVMEDFLTGTG